MTGADRRFAPDYGRFTPGQRAHLWRAIRSAFDRIETCLRRAITQARLTTGASRPDKELAYGNNTGNITGASCLKTGPDKELAYGEQNVQPSAELKPAHGGQYHRRFAPD